MSFPPIPAPLPHPVVDNHTHLDIERAGEHLAIDEALERAASVGVTRMVQVGTDLASSRWAVEAAASHPQLIAAVALHPNDAPLHSAADLEAALDEIEELAHVHDRVRAVGETGLDFFRTAEDGVAAQQHSFRRHIDIAKRHDRTLQIHDRDAHQAILEAIDAEGAPDRWVMHCFSGDASFARECLDRGAHLSFAGTVTFKNAPHLREALAIAPLDRILVETDAPFLTPHPHRGDTNSSYLIPVTLRAMAEVREMDLGELCAAIDANTEAAFGGTW
ncbi:TatD family hydrolase [Nocardioides sp. Kera G14]|uniref:TatD family hydrolase n=1 Tax=Nocardioides sp. Kera G14 TaxID=2884264 RepID=UPI001D0F6B16|nr:TatD family hydrolase [Nocardioides sp. Kera G14]UDY24127.1 TatD family hydrolase [Nocardioides sp. Kera G14]